MGKYTSLPEEDDLLTIGLNRAVALIAESKKDGERDLGVHPDDGKPVTVRKGRYGPYVKHGRTNATLPKGTDMDALELAQAVELIAAKAAKAKKSKGAKGKAKKTAKTAKTSRGKSAGSKESAAPGN